MKFRRENFLRVRLDGVLMTDEVPNVESVLGEQGALRADCRDMNST